MKLSLAPLAAFLSIFALAATGAAQAPPPPAGPAPAPSNPAQPAQPGQPGQPPPGAPKGAFPGVPVAPANPAAPPPGWGPYQPAPGYGSPGAYYPPPQYGYYPPPTLLIPPANLPYEDGDPVPPGYEKRTRPVRSMVIAGSITFGTPYLVSLLTGATVLADGGSDSKQFAPLMIPIVGPFVTIGTAHAQGAGAFWLVLDGLTQAGGAAMLIYGLSATETYLQRTRQTMGYQLTHPDVLVAPGGGSLRWRF